MAPKPKFASQLTRRNISVPSWAWSLVLLAAAVFALTIYHGAQAAPAPNVKARMDQAQESISHYSGALVAGPSALSAVDLSPAANQARQNVLDGIRQPSALSAVDLSPAASRARQNVLDSIRQRNAEPVSPAVNPAVNPAVSSLWDFVAANGLQHASGAREVALDADAVNYTDYLRRQGIIPDTTWYGTPIDPQVQALITASSLVLDEAAAPSAITVDPTGRGMELYIAQYGLNAAVGSAELALDPFAKNLTDYLRQRTQSRTVAPVVVDAPPDRWWEHYGETLHPEREETGVLKFNTKITEREQQLLDQHNQ
jgi:hypothetical protein